MNCGKKFGRLLSAGTRGVGERPTASSGMIPTWENPGPPRRESNPACPGERRVGTVVRPGKAVGFAFFFPLNREMSVGWEKREFPEKTRRSAESSDTILSCKNPVTQPGIEPGSPWWEASVLIVQPSLNIELEVLALRLLASRQGELGSITGGVDFPHVRIVPDDAAGRRVSSGNSIFPRPCVPALLLIRLFDSQDLDPKSRPNLSTELQSNGHCEVAVCNGGNGIAPRKPIGIVHHVSHMGIYPGTAPLVDFGERGASAYLSTTKTFNSYKYKLFTARASRQNLPMTSTHLPLQCSAIDKSPSGQPAMPSCLANSGKDSPRREFTLTSQQISWARGSRTGSPTSKVTLCLHMVSGRMGINRRDGPGELGNSAGVTHLNVPSRLYDGHKPRWQAATPCCLSYRALAALQPSCWLSFTSRTMGKLALEDARIGALELNSRFAHSRNDSGMAKNYIRRRMPHLIVILRYRSTQSFMPREVVGDRNDKVHRVRQIDTRDPGLEPELTISHLGSVSHLSSHIVSR
ncbi:hypothetical protein PR048_006129 [Dryococelus australis]|uniref:Uncharacterized protein n=1 Tax=Dryococelus australis TaxID=614101 RepID=A0ABQ9IA52_9NEOP|nr:hypothetical protein PR048_006129 [Dryococelus australis]